MNAISENMSVLYAWQGFKEGEWQNAINVRDFIQKNYTLYEGDASFLAGPTERTQKVWAKLEELLAQERAKGVLDVSQIPTSITAHEAGYIDKDVRISRVVYSLFDKSTFEVSHKELSCSTTYGV